MISVVASVVRVRHDQVWRAGLPRGPSWRAQRSVSAATIPFRGNGPTDTSHVLTSYHARKVRTSVCCPTKVYTPLADGMEDHNMPFLTPNLMPIQVGRAIVGAFESGLSQDMVMPEALRTLPAMRGLPFWVKRGFQIVSLPAPTFSSSICFSLLYRHRAHTTQFAHSSATRTTRSRQRR